MTSPGIEKNKGISPVWILPILAICIGAWLVYSHIQNAGILISVSFESAEGITAGKTMVRFKGNTVGMVKEVKLSEDLQRINLIIEMEKDAASHLVEDMKFWVEKPEVTADRITGLDTLISGSYIGIQLGTSKTPAKTFVGLPDRPPFPPNAPGLHLTLKADALYAVQVGSGIYHKNLQIGSVQSHALQPDETIQISLFIKPEYQHLVREKSRFWNASGLTVSGGLSGIKVHMESISALIKGGLVMDTPDPFKDSPKAGNGQTFPLYKDFEAAAYGIPLTLKLTTGKGISEGNTPIIYHGMKVGVVKEISFNHDPENSVSAKVLLDPRAKKILTTGTRFFIVNPEFSIQTGAQNLDTLLTGPYISFIPGRGKHQDHFVVDQDGTNFQKPPGINYTLISPNAGSLSKGSPILLKRFQVGEVVNFSLSDDADHVNIEILVYKPFVKHLKTTSRFYNLSGVEVEASLSSGVKVQTGSIASIIAGGLALYTPEKGPAAKPGDTFSLYPDLETAVDSNKVNITIRFKSARGLKKGSGIKYKEALIGTVSKISYEDDYTTAVIEAVVEKKAAHFLRSQTQFWMVEPELSIGDSKHLDTLLSGPYIEMTPGKGSATKKFTALASEPPPVKEKTGLNIVLEGTALSSVKIGSPVFYRRIVIGEVMDFKLSSTFDQVLVFVNIQDPYTGIVREKTRFWNASGIHIHGGVLSGFSVITESLQSVLAGGIGLATPDNTKMGAAVSDGHHFKLYSDVKDEWLEWQPKITQAD